MVKCGQSTCVTRASYGIEGSKKTEFCPRHAKDDMVNVRKLTCRHEGCSKRARFTYQQQQQHRKQAEFCAEHAKAGMVDAGSKTCRHESCVKWPSFGNDGSRATIFCAQHAEADMIDVRRKRCLEQGCRKQPSYGVRGSKEVLYCAFHGKDGMINVCSKRCGHRDCCKHPKFGVNGSTKAEFCRKHAEAGMVNVRRKGYTSCISSSSNAHGRRLPYRTGTINYNTKQQTATEVSESSSSGGCAPGLCAATTAVAAEVVANGSKLPRDDGGPERHSGRMTSDATQRATGGGNAADLAAHSDAAAASDAATAPIVTAGSATAIMSGGVSIKNRKQATRRVQEFGSLISGRGGATERNASEPFMGLRKNRRRLGGSSRGGGFDDSAAKHPLAARPPPMGRDKVCKMESTCS